MDFRLRIDDGDNHSFTGDYSDRLLSASVVRGFDDGIDRVARHNTATINLRRYGLGTNSSEYAVVIGRWVRVDVDDGTGYQSIYYGMILDAVVMDRIVQLQCTGRLSLMNQRQLPLIYQNESIDALVLDTLKRSGLPDKWRASDGTDYAIVGRATVGNCKVSTMTPFGWTADSSTTVFEYWGDEYPYNSLSRNIVRDLLLAEWGLLYETTDGELVFRNRHHILEDRTALATVNRDDARDIDYRVRSRAITQIQGRISERYLSEGDTVYTEAAGRRVPRLGDRTWSFGFEQDDGQVIFITDNLETDVAFVDVYDNPAGVDVILESVGRRVLMHLTNPYNLAAYANAFTITGDVMRKRSPSEFDYRRNTRFTGGNPLNVVIPSFTDEDDLRSLSTIVLSQYDGREQVNTITLDQTSAVIGDFIGGEVYDRVDVDVGSASASNIIAQSIIRYEWQLSPKGVGLVLHCAPYIDPTYYARVGTGSRSQVGSVRVAF